MSNILNLPDGKVVLVLSKEEAEVLGTFRRKYVAGKFRPLYDALRGLPHRSGEFVIEKNVFDPDRPVFSDFIPQQDDVPETGLISRPSMMDVFAQIASPELLTALPRTKWMIECNFGDADDWVPSKRFSGLCFDSKANAEFAIRSHKDFNFRMDTGRYRAVPAAVLKPEGWIVQYDSETCYNHGPGWVRLNTTCMPPGQEFPGERVYSSRNEAYRQLRLRADQMGKPESRYRVVPNGTPDGPEKDRGYYTVQFYFGEGRWGETVNGPGMCGLTQFVSAEDALDAIRRYGTRRDTYRVKWHPSAS